MEDPGTNWWGLAAVIVFYIVILAIGLFASWKKKTLSQTDSEDIMLAGRDIGAFVGIFTMTGLSFVKKSLRAILRVCALKSKLHFVS